MDICKGLTEKSERNQVAARWHRVLALLCCFLSLTTSAATFTASLDRDQISLGETVNLALTFTGTDQQNVPTLPAIPNLQIGYIGPSSQISIVNNQVNSVVTHNFRVTPRQVGDYTIPALSATVGSEKLTTQPLTLKVHKPNASTPNAAAEQLAFIKLFLPKKEMFVGETIVVQVQLYLRSGVQRIRDFQFVSGLGDTTAGWLAGKPVEGQHGQAQVGNSAYTVVPLLIPLKALKTGQVDLGPVTASVVLEIPSSNRRRDAFDPFGMFGGGTEARQVAIATEAEKIQVLPLPPDNVPAGFGGAIGSFTLTASAGPTNLTAGDPITLKVQISGRGSLDSVNLPDQPGWANFKAYPPTTKLESNDPLGLQGTKTFEQVLVPETADVKALPVILFSFFDPDKKQYRTLKHPATALLVRPGGSAPAPTFATARTGQVQPAPNQDIVHIKQRLGAVAAVQTPLIERPWFLALQMVPILALISGTLWRRRTENLAKNPRLRRQREVALLVRKGVADLRRLAAEKNSDGFFATLFHLLQEQLGERLDLPALAITEAVIEDRLRPAGVDPKLLGALQQLFQTCNQARYAPLKGSEELEAIVATSEQAFHSLKDLKV